VGPPRAALALVMLAGCGRLGFDAGSPAPADADPLAPDADPFAPEPDADPLAPDASFAALDAAAAGCTPGCVPLVEYCMTPPGQCDAPGTCTMLPDPGNMCQDVVDPVCGCDNMIYSNACYMAHAGISLRSTGTCGQ
jgi:hypothetical protein